MVFTVVEFVRRNGLPVFVQPRHVAALEPIEVLQGMETLIVMVTGQTYEIAERPSVVRARLGGP